MGLCIWGCPLHPPHHTLLGKTLQVIHLTRAEKQVQLDILISPLLAGMVPAAAQSTPSPGAACPFWFPWALWILLVSGTANWGYSGGSDVTFHLDALWLVVGTGQVDQADVVPL